MIGYPIPYDSRRDDECYRFNEQKAAFVIGFIEKFCQHVKGPLAGKPIVLEPWQRQLISDLFGWEDAKGRRRYREAFIYIPRKQSKTTLAAAIALAYFFTDLERGQEIYCAAAEQKQAVLLWSIAKQMVLQEPRLQKRCKIFESAQRIARELDGSFFTPLSSKANTKHGLNPSMVLVDEIHAHRTPELYETLKTGTGSRAEPLIISTTTADHNRESLCNQLLKYARAVRDGHTNDPTFYPAIWETMPDEDWKSPAVWKACNPNFNVSVPETFYAAECKRAQAVPAYENEFRRLYLNQVTDQDCRWLAMDTWDACAGEIIERGPCFGGLDLASTRDISALTLYWPKTNSVRMFAWIPEDGAKQREERDRVPYRTWERAGLVQMTPGNVTDYAFIRAELQRIAKSCDLKSVGYDPYNARHLALELVDDGLDMVEHRQGFLSMNEPAKMLERLVLSKALRHGGNACLRWMASNVSVERDPAGNIKPSKTRSSEKIDGIVAAVMAIGASMLGDGKRSGPSVYETRGALVI